VESSDLGGSNSDASAMFRVLGAGLGLVVILTGCALCLVLFFNLWRAVDHPEVLSGKVAQWTEMLGGDQLVWPVPAGSDPGSDAAARGERSGRGAERIPLARPLAVFMVVLVYGLLVRLAIALISAGGRLMGLAQSDKELVKSLLFEVRRTQAGASAGTPK